MIADEDFAPLSPAEIVSELCFAGKAMAEIARYDDFQLFHVILRARDKFGRLIRRMVGLPDWVEVDEDGMRVISNPKPFQTMFQQVGRRAGWSEGEINQAWGRYKEMYPKLGRMEEETVAVQ